MSDPIARIELGTAVSCTEGKWGELRDVVIDPRRTRITHLVVEPSGVPSRARLVPIEWVREDVDDSLLLGCNAAELERAPLVQELAQLDIHDRPPDDPDWDVGVYDVVATPYQESGAFVEYLPEAAPNIMMTYDRVPKGLIEIRRSSYVTTVDGHDAGRLHGFLADHGRITHIILQRGHLWGRHEITIPVEAMSEVETDRLTLSLSAHELEAST